MKKTKNKKPAFVLHQNLVGDYGKAKKVIVAMSGGIDSSVSAALLKKAGFNVVGVYMKLWKETKRGSSSENEKRAEKVAKKIDIPFYIFNFEKEFKKKVVDYFLREFKSGLTPNPCVVCNKEIKFELLFKKLQSSADYIATGHYARLGREILNSKFQITNYRYRLLRGKDKNKDQSYFLWRLNQKILKRALFPLGDYKKSQVKKLAREFRLPVIDVPESQEICFIHTTLNDFLKRYLKTKPGRIIDSNSKTIGKHQGLWFYTIGQRKGIELPGGPYYVLDKDLRKNLLIVTKKERDLFKKELIAKEVNWISGQKPKLPLKVKAKIRYGHKAVSATLTYHPSPNTCNLIFGRYQRAVTPGQSVVFYRDEELLGGGIIV